MKARLRQRHEPRYDETAAKLAEWALEFFNKYLR